MRNSLSVAVFALVVAAGESVAAPNEVITPELAAAYRAVLANPTDTQISLNYARIAESLGQDRKALSTYERILINDPGNRDALVGLQRIRRKMQPEFTKYSLETGVSVESNPRHLNSGGESDFAWNGSLTVRDERVQFDHRWRTDLKVLGRVYGSNSDLNYGYAGGTIAPILDILPRISALPFVGGGAATLDGNFYYAETTFGVTFEGRLNGAYQSVRARGGYRQYDESFTSDSGFYADLTGKFSHPDIFSERDVFIVSPTLRWSDIEGSGFNVDAEEVRPGQYLQWQTELGYYNQLYSWLTLGVGAEIGQMLYRADMAPTGKREDLRIAPKVSVTFNNLFKFESDLVFEYQYEWNDSNDPVKDYENHIGSARLVHRF